MENDRIRNNLGKYHVSIMHILHFYTTSNTLTSKNIQGKTY